MLPEIVKQKEVWLSVEGRTSLSKLRTYFTSEIRKATRKHKRAEANARIFNDLVFRIPEPYYTERDAPSEQLSAYFNHIHDRAAEAISEVDNERAKAEHRISELFMLGVELAQLEKEIHHALNPSKRRGAVDGDKN